MFKKIILFLCLVLLIQGCFKDGDGETALGVILVAVLPKGDGTRPRWEKCFLGNCDTSKLQLVWQLALRSDSTHSSSIAPITYNGTVLFSRNDTLIQSNAKTGAVNWAWSDYMQRGDPQVYLSDGNYIVNVNDDVYFISAQNGAMLSKSRFMSRGDYKSGAAFGKSFYKTSANSSFTQTETARIVGVKIGATGWDTVFSQPAIGGAAPFLSDPGFWVSPAGDTIMLVKSSYYNFKTSVGLRQDLIAYNLTRKNVYFRMDSIEPGEGGKFPAPFIFGNRAYVAFSSKLYCINLPTQTVKWSQTVPVGGYNDGQNLFKFINNDLYVEGGNQGLYVLNPETGAISWSDLQANDFTSNLIYYKGLLYFTGYFNLNVYDVQTRTKILTQPSPNSFPNRLNGGLRFGGYMGGIAIDTTLGYLYASDGYFNMCIKLPKL